MNYELALREVTLLSVVLRILAAIVVGGLIGLERGLKNRPAGLRTYMTVCLGACLIMLTNQYIYQVTATGDPVRMGAQVVSGIGFLGAGTIIVTRRNQIKGLTTAAGLWAAAGVGLALGIGFYEAGLIGGLAIFSVMTLLQKMDNSMHRKTKTMEIYVELNRDCNLGDFLAQVREKDIIVQDTAREQDNDLENGIRAYFSTLRLKKRMNHMEIIDEIRLIPGVVCVEEL
ncbi:MAG: MgtC/SapB family protein [Oscillospiraceae bacterium]|nr:MgtC/SapB family protein [Oscillospiraceae bacterium]